MLGDGIANAVNKGESEGYVDCSGDFGAVAQVEVREVGDDLFYGMFGWDGGHEGGLNCHAAISEVP